MTYIVLALLAVALVVMLARGGRQLRVRDAILGFARSMDTTSIHAASRRPPRTRAAGD